jgi:hypothetical protein
MRYQLLLLLGMAAVAIVGLAFTEVFLGEEWAPGVIGAVAFTYLALSYGPPRWAITAGPLCIATIFALNYVRMNPRTTAGMTVLAVTLTANLAFIWLRSRRRPYMR